MSIFSLILSLLYFIDFYLLKHLEHLQLKVFMN